MLPSPAHYTAPPCTPGRGSLCINSQGIKKHISPSHQGGSGRRGGLLHVAHVVPGQVAKVEAAAGICHRGDVADMRAVGVVQRLKQLSVCADLHNRTSTVTYYLPSRTGMQGMMYLSFTSDRTCEKDIASCIVLFWMLWRKFHFRAGIQLGFVMHRLCQPQISLLEGG